MAKSFRPTPRQASIFINKLEAARRQLDAAIRMTFAYEDELAIHTVAAAAYRILRDMLDKRGRHDLEDLYRAGLYRMAEDFVNGKLSKDKLIELQIYELVSTVAEDIKVRGDEVTAENIPLTLDVSSKKAHWQAMSGVSGFLKHADRHPEALISLHDVNNESLIWHACVSYIMISRTCTPEMVTFWLFWAATNAHRDGLSTDQTEIVDYLERLSPSRRRRACIKFIRIGKRGDDLDNRPLVPRADAARGECADGGTGGSG
jgi:hypothetical protein